VLAIGIDLLGGRYVATTYNDRERAEWPPHPARLFSALVATWAETSSRDEAGASALAWLAEQLPPIILASASGDIARRSVMTVFVPVNDVSVVSSPDRQKLDAAINALSMAQEQKTRAKATKEVSRLEAKLVEATTKAIAYPARLNKGDADAGRAVLPESRTRQQRTFPCVTPQSPRFGFVWPDAKPTATAIEALSGLLARLVRLGHSSSFVAARILSDDDVKAMGAKLTTYREEPEAGEHIIRWVGPRQLRALEAAFELHQEAEPRVLPAVFITYGEGERRVDSKPRSSIFDPNFIVLARVGGPRLPITAVAGVSRQLRRALMSAFGADVPELLSGHKPDGSASESPHLAIVPLPVVGGPHADGALLGVALVLPMEADRTERQRVLAAIGKLGLRSDPEDSPTVHLHLGAAGVMELQLSEWGEDSRATLRASRWTQPSRMWATATPIALDRNPGDLHASSQPERAAAFMEAEASVGTACERIGLTRPRVIEVLRSCVLTGSAKPLAHGPFPPDPSKPQRVLVHARIEFDQKVRGPLLVGAGRFQGMGLCLPVDPERETFR
jgi:CRISPR-associated protein Csb2